MAIKWSKEEESRLTDLLNLDDNRLRRHKMGKMIRDNFELRGWLKAQPRGNPKKGYAKQQEAKAKEED